VFASDPVGLFCPSLVPVGGADLTDDELGRYAYQLVTEKSGWILLPTCSGGLVTGWVVSSPVDSRFLADLGVPVLWSSGEVMVDRHLQPGRSACLRYVDAFNILLFEAIKKSICSSERGMTSSCRRLRSSVTRTTGIFLQGLACKFSIFQECLCKNVNIMKYM
jgi:hypothetical protein